MPRFDASQYVDVQERIGRFWREYPDGAINTQMETPGSQFEAVVFQATIYKHRDDLRASATGYAAEERGTDARSGANFTAWHENAETSAIGRALANMGYATTREDRPSRQEMQKVERVQNAPVAHQNPRSAPEPSSKGNPSTPGQRKRIEAIAKKREITHDDWKAIAQKKYKVESTNDLTEGQAREFAERLDTMDDVDLLASLVWAGRREPLPAQQAEMIPGESQPDYSHYTR